MAKCRDSKKIHLDFMYFLSETLGCYTLVYERIEHFRDKWENSMSTTLDFLLYRLAQNTHVYVNNKNDLKRMN